MAVICSCAQENLGSVRRTCTDVRARGTKRRIVLSRRQNETQGISNGGVAFRKIRNPRGDVKHRAQMFRISCVGSEGVGNERERRERARAPGTVREWDPPSPSLRRNRLYGTHGTYGTSVAPQADHGFLRRGNRPEAAPSRQRLPRATQSPITLRRVLGLSLSKA
jgi:hypothetical protein